MFTAMIFYHVLYNLSDLSAALVRNRRSTLYVETEKEREEVERYNQFGFRFLILSKGSQHLHLVCRHYVSNHDEPLL